MIAPSSGGAASARGILALGVRRLRERFDLSPVVHPTAHQSDDYLRAHPRTQAVAIHEAFRAPDVDGAIATIGGDDQLRVLRHLDPEVLRANPTRFYGMSDNTNLALYLWREGIVSFYGGQRLNQVATPGSLPAYTERYLRRTFFEDTLGELDAAGTWADLAVGWDREDDADPGYEPAPGWTWTGGEETVEGRLWGDCLAILEWQLMTDRYLPEPDCLDGAVLLLETAEDLPPAERVRWTLMSMGERGLLGRFDAVLVGRPATENWREERSAGGYGSIPTTERSRFRRASRRRSGVAGRRAALSQTPRGGRQVTLPGGRVIVQEGPEATL